MILQSRQNEARRALLGEVTDQGRITRVYWVEESESPTEQGLFQLGGLLEADVVSLITEPQEVSLGEDNVVSVSQATAEDPQYLLRITYPPSRVGELVLRDRSSFEDNSF